MLGGGPGEIRPGRSAAATDSAPSAENVALASALIGARVERGAVLVPQDRRVPGVVPDVPGMVPVPVGLRAGAVAGVDGHVSVRLDRVRAEHEYVPGLVAERPVGQV